MRHRTVCSATLPVLSYGSSVSSKWWPTEAGSAAAARPGCPYRNRQSASRRVAPTLGLMTRGSLSCAWLLDCNSLRPPRPPLLFARGSPPPRSTLTLNLHLPTITTTLGTWVSLSGIACLGRYRGPIEDDTFAHLSSYYVVPGLVFAL